MKATTFYTIEDDGLTKEWSGRVWMNPPYSSKLIKAFCQKLVESEGVTDAVVLTNNATDTKWCRMLQDKASAICLITGRISFWFPGRDSKTPLQGQIIHYIGDDVDKFCNEFDQFGVTWVK